MSEDTALIIVESNCVDGALPKTSAPKPTQLFTIRSTLVVRKVCAIRRAGDEVPGGQVRLRLHACRACVVVNAELGQRTRCPAVRSTGGGHPPPRQRMMLVRRYWQSDEHVDVEQADDWATVWRLTIRGLRDSNAGLPIARSPDSTMQSGNFRSSITKQSLNLSIAIRQCPTCSPHRRGDRVRRRARPR